MQGLPADGALARARGAWTRMEDLTALLTEVADVQNVILMKVNTTRSTKVRDPIRIPRPGNGGDKEDAPVIATGEDMASFAALHGGRVVRAKPKPKPKPKKGK